MPVPVNVHESEGVTALAENIFCPTLRYRPASGAHPMPDPSPNPSSRDGGTSRDTLARSATFPATQWSLVLRAQKEGIEASKALNDLCSRYWYPLYAYLRSRNFGREDAQDITQTFFLKAVMGGLLQSADQERGKLRSFLLAALTRHIADHLRHERAEKRGGRAIMLPMECFTAEERFVNEPADTRDPEKLFLTAWARGLMERVRQKLRAYYERTKRAEMFAVLEPCLAMDESATPYRELARRLSTTEASLRMQVHRTRQRFGKLLREEVGLTVQSEDELEEEMTWLAGVLRGG